MVFAAGAASAGGDAPATRPAEVTLPAAERPGSAWDVLLRGEGRDRFLELADRVGLRRVLDGEHAVTVFAPSDAAFDALDEAELAELLTPERRPALRELVAGHVLWGETRSGDVQGVLMRPTLPGFAVVIRREVEGEGHEHGVDCGHGDEEAGVLVVADVRVAERDRAARNGVIHGVDALIRRPARSAESGGELAHAPACGDDSDHARDHSRPADRSRRREARRSGGGGGSADEPGGGPRVAQSDSLGARTPEAGPPPRRPASGGGAGGNGGNGGGCGCGAG